MVDPVAIAPGSDTHVRLHEDDADRSILQAGRIKPASVRTGSGSDPIQAQLEWSIPSLSLRVLTCMSGCMTTMLIAQLLQAGRIKPARRRTGSGSDAIHAPL